MTRRQTTATFHHRRSTRSGWGRGGLLDDHPGPPGRQGRRVGRVTDLEPGHPGRSAKEVELDEANAEIARRGEAVKALTPAEVEAILEAFAEFGEKDFSHRRLAHRGSYENLFWASQRPFAAS
ncbi:MAG: hypothetical protein V9G19_00625 [Tetrasphaera sp.]